MSLIRLATRFNFREVEAEWQWEFVFYVLSNLGIPDDLLSECLPEDGSMKDISVQHKIKLRKYLSDFDVSIMDDKDGGIKIYVYNDEQYVLVAKWEKCKFIYKENLSEIDPEKRIYVELQTNTWTIFEQGENEQN